MGRGRIHIDPHGSHREAQLSERQPFHGLSLEASLTVRDLQASTEWYEHVFGFSIDRKYERDGKLVAVSLRAGEVSILLGQDDGSKGWDRNKGEGFSLQITTADNIDEVARRIKESGGILELEPTDTPWGRRIFRLRDPDGFKFTISSRG
jgi:uncharacterized glyoxalase superfamily protein PhnB